jgi:hypothetical protein
MHNSYGGGERKLQFRKMPFYTIYKVRVFFTDYINIWENPLKGKSHEKVGEIRAWNISLGPN